MRRALSLLVATLVAVACSAGGSTVPTTSVLTLGEPDPPLPSDINVMPYYLGELVALGNLKIILDAVDDPAPAAGAPTRTVTVDARVENGSLTPLTLDPASMRLYVASGASATPNTESATSMTTPPLASGEFRAIVVRFEVPANQPLVLLVLDGARYGERVSSAGIVPVPRPPDDPADG